MEPKRFGDNLLLTERIGAGGMGEVFRAKQLGTQGFEKIVAVKRILPALSLRKDIATLFAREMRIASLLHHSNIAQIFSNGQVEDYLYYVMEYVRGKDLCAIMEFCASTNSALRIDHACFIVAETARGLHYAHSLQDEETGEPLRIVHRDVTPNNIICSVNGEVKILDFGIAKISGHNDQKTQPHDIRGSMNYISPEQLLGTGTTCKSDIYSIGVVLWELLAGRPLFEDKEPFAVMTQIIHKKIPSVQSIRPEVPRELDRIVMKALNREPAARYSSAGELHKRLNSFLNTHFPHYSPSDLGGFVLEVDAASNSNEPNSAIPHRTRRLANPVTVSSPGFLSHNPALRYTIGIAISVIIGLVVGLGYLYWMDQTSQGPLNGLPIIFASETVRTTTDQRVDQWVATVDKQQLAFTQTDAAHMPLLIPNALAGRSVVKFDGIDDFLQSTSLAKPLSQARGVTVLMVTKLTLDKHGYLLSFSQQDKDSNVFRLGTDDSGKPVVKVNEESWLRMLIVGVSRFPHEYMVLSAVVSGDNVQVSLNRTISISAQTPQPVPLKKTSSVSLGATLYQGKPDVFLSAEIAEIQVFTRALDPYSLSMVEEHLSHKYNIPLPPAARAPK